MPSLVEVVAGLIQDEKGRFLVTRRRAGSHLAGFWEFPGGKRESGESLEDALRRELEEELSARFEIGERVETARWEYPERTIVIHFYRCRLESGTIEPREDQAMDWVAPERLSELDFPPADRDLITRLRAGAS